MTTNAATLNGSLASTGGVATTVFLFWGATDGGTTKAGWNNTNNFGVKATGAVSKAVSGLGLMRTYYYRYYATNSAGQSWASSTTNFTTLAQLPAIDDGIGATLITATNALLNGRLTSTGGAPTTVFVYWGATNGGTNSEAWSNASNLGILSTGLFSRVAANLAANVKYYYRCCASNVAGQSWSAGKSNFITRLSVPAIENAAATGMTTNSATLNATLASTGGVATTVCVFWGSTDAGANKAGWGNTNNLGVHAAGVVSKAVSGLGLTKTYYYRFYATNSMGQCWASSTTSFTTLAQLPTINNSVGASRITTSNAWLNGTLTSTGKAPATVTIYWGLSDGGTVQAAWGNTNNLGFRPAGSFSNQAANLGPNVQYYYRCYATNADGDGWAAGTSNFTTKAALPVVDNGSGASGITATNAWLNGNLTTTGGAPTTVFEYWGGADGVTNKAKWQNANNLGILSTGTFSNLTPNMSPNTRYYYRCCASNIAGQCWATGTSNFTTLISVPAIENAGVTGITTNSATLNGSLVSTGGVATTVCVFWGLADVGANKVGWGNTNNLGVNTAGIVSKTVSGLGLMRTYYYRYYATNLAGQCWSSATSNFTTLAAMPAITTAGSTGIKTNAAMMCGSLTFTGGAPTTVFVYWGAINGGTNVDKWGNANNLGILSTGYFLSAAANLSPNIKYYYRCCASNVAGRSWAAGTSNFTTLAAAPAVENAGATYIKTNAATLNGNVTSTGGVATTVYVYWGATDGGTNKAGWSKTSNIGVKDEGAVSKSVNGLNDMMNYHYRYYASNSAGQCWAPSSTNFTTLAAPPAIDNGAGATRITSTNAWLNGNLTSTGGVPTTVYVYWGATNAGSNGDKWANVVELGEKAVGALSNKVDGLDFISAYYYRYYASNSAGGSWAAPSKEFRTLPARSISGTISYSGGQTGSIRVIAVTATNSWSTRFGTILTNCGAYSITNIPNQTSYWVKAWCDSNGNLSNDTAEAWGTYPGNPVCMTNSVKGADIALTDPDSDGDGLPDWVETGTGIYISPTNTGTSPRNWDTDGDGISDSMDGFPTIAGPKITILAPNANAAVTSSPVVIIGKITSSNDLRSVTVYGSNTVVVTNSHQSGLFTFTFTNRLSLADGPHSIDIEVVATNGLASQKWLYINMDASGPDIAILSPANGTVVTQQHVPVTVQSDCSNAIVTVTCSNAAGKVNANAVGDGCMYYAWVACCTNAVPSTNVITVRLVATNYVPWRTNQAAVTICFNKPGYNPATDDNQDYNPAKSPEIQGAIQWQFIQPSKTDRHVTIRGKFADPSSADAQASNVCVILESSNKVDETRREYDNVPVTGDSGASRQFEVADLLLYGTNSVSVWLAGQNKWSNIGTTIFSAQADVLKFSLQWTASTLQIYGGVSPDAATLTVVGPTSFATNVISTGTSGNQVDWELRGDAITAGVYQVYAYYDNERVDYSTPGNQSMCQVTLNGSTLVSTEPYTVIQQNSDDSGEYLTWPIATVVINKGSEVGGYQVRQYARDEATDGDAWHIRDMISAQGYVAANNGVVPLNESFYYSTGFQVSPSDFNGPNGSDPVYLRVGESAQFTASGTVGGETEKRGILGEMSVFDTNGAPVSTNIAYIDTLGVFTGVNPGHVLVNCASVNTNIDVYILKVDLAVDGNRDGTIDFDNLEDKKLRFWLNDDEDVATTSWHWKDSDPETVPVQQGMEDSADSVINSPRDLEDFARLHLRVSGNLREKLQSGELVLGFKWKNADTPGIRIYKAFERDGGWEYIKDPIIAQSQLSGDFKNALRDSVSSLTEILPGLEAADFCFDRTFWNGWSSGDITNHFIFEGVDEGKGNLVPVLLNSDRTASVFEGSAVHLELRNIERLYMRAHSNPKNNNFAFPYEVNVSAMPNFPYIAQNGGVTIPDGNLGYASGFDEQEDSQMTFEKADDEENKCIVFVHGIDLTVPEVKSYTASFYKRLWWEGYRGRLAVYRWSTTLTESDDQWNVVNCGNAFLCGEFRSWYSGFGLKQFVEYIKGKDQMPGATMSIAGHSLGNACVGDALTRGMQVDNYVMLEAAVSLSCYFPQTLDGRDPLAGNYVQDLLNAESSKPTPDVTGEFGYRASLKDIRSNIHNNWVNYYNPQDFWLRTGHINILNQNLWPCDWVSCQKSWKPMSIAEGEEYWFSSSAGSQFSTTPSSRPVADRYEGVSFVARSRTYPLGAESADGVPKPPSAQPSLNLNTDYDFGSERYDHSGQFQRDIQYLYSHENNGVVTKYDMPFYWKLMEDLDVKPTVEPQ